jgi:hypothetical protein
LLLCSYYDTIRRHPACSDRYLSYSYQLSRFWTGPAPVLVAMGPPGKTMAVQSSSPRRGKAALPNL